MTQAGSIWRWANRQARRRISWTDHRTIGGSARRGAFWGAMTAFARWRITASRAKASMTSETWRCQPCQLRVSLWSSPLGGLEAVLDRPAATFGTDQGLDGRALRAPGGEKGQALVGEAASDEQAARPQAMAARIALSLCLEVRQHHHTPSRRAAAPWCHPQRRDGCRH